MPESNTGVPMGDSLLDAMDDCGDELVLGFSFGLDGGRATDKGEIIRSRRGRWRPLPLIEEEEDIRVVLSRDLQVWVRRRASMCAITDGAFWALGSALTRIGLCGCDSAGGTKRAAMKSEAGEDTSTTPKRAGTDALARICSGDGQ